MLINRLVRPTGRSVNPQEQIESLLETLLEPVERCRRVKLLRAVRDAMERPEPIRTKLRLTQGAIHKKILEVLKAANAPLSIKQIHELVEQKLGCSISYDTVTSYLTSASRNYSKTGICRVGSGIYLKTKHI